ncbi:uncharacterized protein ARMOST_07115 [Armillaria ostoyae]|uniref:Uncharacterized protein n=1 Tax=Armillaria ostoyae TaxID=47428 RepID=A0A284R4X5_ARMOS|nr:uncharacterized protein ARMOST_07115 [Armillaria ostoyae]
MLFSDEPMEKIKRRIFWTIQLSTRTTKPCSFIDLGSSHCVSLLTYETGGKYNDGALPRVKITRLTTIGVSKYINNLDVSNAPSEVDLSRADFLEYYNGFSESFLYASIPTFGCGLKPTKTSTRITALRLFKGPFIPHSSSRNWSDGVQTGKDNYWLMQQEA